MSSQNDFELELLAQSLIDVREQIKIAKEQESELIQALADAMPAKRYELAGVGTFERHKASTRKTWDNDSLSSALIRKIRTGEVPKQVDDETGEVIDEDDVAQTARIFTECARPSWRLTPLRALGVDPDEYSEVTYDGSWTIQFTGAQS